MILDCTHCPRTVLAGETCECGEPAPDESELLNHEDRHPTPYSVAHPRPKPPGDRYA